MPSLAVVCVWVRRAIARPGCGHVGQKGRCRRSPRTGGRGEQPAGQPSLECDRPCRPRRRSRGERDASRHRARRVLVRPCGRRWHSHASGRARVAAWTAARERLTRPPADDRPGTAPRQGIFRRDGSHWVVGLGDSQVVVPHSVGMTYLAELLARPGTDVSAMSLVGGAEELQEASRQPLIDDRARRRVPAPHRRHQRGPGRSGGLCRHRAGGQAAIRARRPARRAQEDGGAGGQGPGLRRSVGARPNGGAQGDQTSRHAHRGGRPESRAAVRAIGHDRLDLPV